MPPQNSNKPCIPACESTNRGSWLKANGVVRQQETILTFEGTSPSLHPSQPFQPHQQEDSQTTMENMCSRTTVWEGPYPPQHTPLQEEKSKTILECLHQDTLNK